MWRSVATCAFTLGACASAEPPGEIMDASSDAPRPRDAAIDARPIDAMMNLCPSTDTCAGATMLGTVSGDLTSAKLTASGYRAAWFRVRVTENDDNVPGLKLRVASKLTFPATVGFETFVYVNAGSDVASECATTTGTRSTVGNMQTVKAEWGEGIVPNFVDDSRNVSIEVRPVGTNCSPTATWQLEIEGDWL